MDHSPTWDDVLAAAQARWQASTLPADDWQRGFASVLAQVVARWQLSVEQILPHGAGVPVCAVRTSSGQPAVLKFGRPADLNPEVAMLHADAGRSTVAVLDHDPEAAAVLVERLGRPLGDVEPDPRVQCRRLAEALQVWWQVPLEVAPNYSMFFGGSKARGLRNILDVQGAQFGEGAPLAVARAKVIADELAVDEACDVVCHGDPHPWNLLEHPSGGWRFVDPDGLTCERAYDLGVVLRGFGSEVIALEDERTGAGAEFLAGLADELAAVTEVDRDRILAWAFVERVTTGLYCLMYGHDRDGREHLASAEALARAAQRA